MDDHRARRTPIALFGGFDETRAARRNEGEFGRHEIAVDGDERHDGAETEQDHRGRESPTADQAGSGSFGIAKVVDMVTPQG